MQYCIIANTTSRPIWSKGERFQWTSFKEFFSRSTFCKISNNFSWNSLDFKFGHFKIFDELIFQFWRLSVRFSDNYIAKRFQCVGSSAGYVVQFRLAPYFHEPMLSKLSDWPYFIFWRIFKQFSSESSNDVIIRFWDSEENCVATRYLGSELMVRSILAGISDLDQRYRRLLQRALIWIFFS